MMRKMVQVARALDTDPRRRVGGCRPDTEGSERNQRYDPEGVGEKAYHLLDHMTKTAVAELRQVKNYWANELRAGVAARRDIPVTNP
jgi:hypothetical protein